MDIKASYFVLLGLLFDMGFLAYPTSVRNQDGKHRLLIFQENNNNGRYFIKNTIPNFKYSNTKEQEMNQSVIFLLSYFVFPPWYKQMGCTKILNVI